MTTTVFELVGGPWDGQVLSTAADDEANACFAQALLAMTGGRVGSRIPLISPAGNARIDAGVSKPERQAMNPHAYEIVSMETHEATRHLRAQHCAGG